jgi:uncharacterized protein YbaR (Trm112 family)
MSNTTNSKAQTGTLRPELVAVLACPACKGALQERHAAKGSPQDGFVCPKCSLLFAVVDGIPNFLLEDALKLPD